MKFLSLLMVFLSVSRAPQGARGLKLLQLSLKLLRHLSRPARGAWVEISR